MIKPTKLPLISVKGYGVSDSRYIFYNCEFINVTTRHTLITLETGPLKVEVTRFKNISRIRMDEEDWDADDLPYLRRTPGACFTVSSFSHLSVIASNFSNIDANAIALYDSAIYTLSTNFNNTEIA